MKVTIGNGHTMKDVRASFERAKSKALEEFDRREPVHRMTPCGMPTDKQYVVVIEGVRVATDRKIDSSDVGIILSITKQIRMLKAKAGESPTHLLIGRDGGCEAFFPDRDSGIIIEIDWGTWSAR